MYLKIKQEAVFRPVRKPKSSDEFSALIKCLLATEDQSFNTEKERKKIMSG